jgi:hypothetical protein
MWHGLDLSVRRFLQRHSVNVILVVVMVVMSLLNNMWFSGKLEGITRRIDNLTRRIDNIDDRLSAMSGQTAWAALEGTAVDLLVVARNGSMAWSGLGSVARFRHGCYIVTAGHNIAKLMGRTTVLFAGSVTATVRPGTQLALTGNVWFANGLNPDVAWLEINTTQTKVTRYLKIAHDLMREGEPIYWEVFRDLKTMMGRCDVSGQQGGRRYRTTCGGAPGFSGAGYVNQEGRLVGVHQGSGMLERSDSAKASGTESKIEEESWDAVWAKCIMLGRNCSCAKLCNCTDGNQTDLWNCTGPCECSHGCDCDQSVNASCMCNWSDPGSVAGPCNCTQCVSNNTTISSSVPVTGCQCPCHCDVLPGISGLCLWKLYKVMDIVGRNPRTFVEDVTWVPARGVKPWWPSLGVSKASL